MTSTMASEKESPSDNAAREEQFLRKMHVHYYVKQLAVLPFEYVMLDTSRLTAIYFCVVGLDMLGALDLIKKDVIIDFIYGMQLTPAVASKEVFCGFVGSSFLGQGFQVNDTAKDCGCSDSPIAGHLGQYTQGHIAMTYCAICVLLTLGDDLSRLDRTGLAKGLKALQRPDGSFSATLEGSESDVRFLYCACAIASMLGDWSFVDTEKAKDYVYRCVGFDGGIGLNPECEAQGGATFCALASLMLMGKLHADAPDSTIEASDATDTKKLIDGCRHWCVQRQVGGYQGRTGKDPDTCYSFWVGGSLSLLDAEAFSETHFASTRAFILTQCQPGVVMDEYRGGGFSKLPEMYPDILHTFYSLAWLSMSEEVSERRTSEASPLPSPPASVVATGSDAVTGMIEPGSEGEVAMHALGKCNLRPLDIRLCICADRVPAHMQPAYTASSQLDL